MKIEYLIDNTDFMEEVTGWIYDEFIDNIREDVTYEDVVSSFESSKKDELPIRLIAIEDGRCIGTISLIENDLKGSEYTPWLAAIYVDIPYRNNKIGEQLIERVKKITGDLGYRELYLRTEHAREYYRKLGWQYVESGIDEYGLELEIYKFILTE